MIAALNLGFAVIPSRLFDRVNVGLWQTFSRFSSFDMAWKVKVIQKLSPKFTDTFYNKFGSRNTFEMYKITQPNLFNIPYISNNALYLNIFFQYLFISIIMIILNNNLSPSDITLKQDCRSPEYNERVKNLTSEWNQKQQRFIPHASRSLLCIRFAAVAFWAKKQFF